MPCSRLLVSQLNMSMRGRPRMLERDWVIRASGKLQRELLNFGGAFCAAGGGETGQPTQRPKEHRAEISHW